MKDLASARELATRLTETGNRFGVATEAIISDMSRPLGRFIGNALEVYETIKILRNEPLPGTETTRELSLELTAGMLVLCGIDENAAREMVETRLRSGDALEVFRENVVLQDGDPAVCDSPEMLIDRTLVEMPICAVSDGIIAAVDTAKIGNSIVDLGGGRVRAEDEIDHSVGVSIEASVGDAVSAGDEIGRIFARTQPQAEAAATAVANAFTIGDRLIREPTPLIIERIQNRETVSR
jgi:thymidine phosphorylase